jgi:hypothetical protein
MKILLLFVALFQVNQEQVSLAYNLHEEGLVDSALLVLRSIEHTERDSVYYVARNLEAWILMDMGDRSSLQNGFDILNEEIPRTPYPLTKTRMLSLRGYINQAWGNMNGFRMDQEASYKLSKEIGDTVGMSLALRNVYYYYSKRNRNPDEVEWFVAQMKSIDGDDIHRLRTLFVESYYEHKYGSIDKAIGLIAQAKSIVPDNSEQWTMDVHFAQATFLVSGGNLSLAEEYLVELLEDSSLDLSWSSKYRILARLVQIYMEIDRKDLASEAIDLMESMSSNSIDSYSIEIGAFAKMAFAGATNAYELDPVFSGYKKSGLDWWAKFLIVAAGLGLLAALAFASRLFLCLLRPEIL